MNLTIKTFLFGCLISASLVSCKRHIVKTYNGRVAGSIEKSRGGTDFYAFKGIPYGTVVKRFELAIPVESWTKTKDSTEHTITCPQPFVATGTEVYGDEDCLVLNVYTPNITVASDSERYPVIVYIHGGAFQFGTGAEFGGSYFMDAEVILVTLNYRLGALGFLSTGDDIIKGNMGLKDQVLALQWVQRNIGAFGGDKKRVTLMGTSAGSASVSLHVLSPLSAGLFHRAICISGSALNPWAIHEDSLEFARGLGKDVGCPTGTTSALADCLKNQNYRAIVHMRAPKWHADPIVPFGPVVEKSGENQPSSDLFLTEEPISLLQQGKFNKVPIIYGIMEDEGLLFHAAAVMSSENLQDEINREWKRVAPITLEYDFADYEDVEEVSSSIRHFYFGDKPIDKDTFSNLTNLYSDRSYIHGVRKAALLSAKHTQVYPFIMAFKGDWTILNSYYGDVFNESPGVTHGDDMRFLFNDFRLPAPKEGTPSEQFSKLLVNLFTSFAKTGTPVVQEESPSNEQWRPISTEEANNNTVNWYRLDIPSKMTPEPFEERMEFWDKVNGQLQQIKENLRLPVGRDEL